MRFLPSPDQEAFASSLRDLLTAADCPSIARAWATGDTAPGRKLWSRLADQGVLALLLEDEHGGFGAGPVDLVLAFEQLGKAAVPGPLVESAAVLPNLLPGTPHADLLTAIGTGECMATLAFAPHVPYALDAGVADAVFTVLDGSLLRGRVSGPIASVDATRRLCEVESDGTGTQTPTDRAFDAGVLATAAQTLGLGAAVLDRSVAYAKQRRQFGREIGGFQAVKHQLADAAVGLELARPLLFGAALALGTTTSRRDVSAAKVACAEAAYRASRTALQVHGAIGYTAEYDLSIWLTKIRALMSAWGTRSFHRGRVLEAITLDSRTPEGTT